jgi:quinolinate synthase
MNRIDLPHLVWALESLVEGRVVNPIHVDPDVAHWARSRSTRCSPYPARQRRTDGSSPCG